MVAKLDQSLNQTKTELDEFKRNMNSKTTQVFLNDMHWSLMTASLREPLQQGRLRELYCTLLHCTISLLIWFDTTSNWVFLYNSLWIIVDRFTWKKLPTWLGWTWLVATLLLDRFILLFVLLSLFYYIIHASFCLMQSKLEASLLWKALNLTKEELSTVYKHLNLEVSLTEKIWRGRCKRLIA